MVFVLVKHKVADYDKWKGMFDADKDARVAAGQKSERVFRSQADPSETVLLFEWESIEKLNEFMGSDHLKQKMQEAGVTSQPDVMVLDEV